MSIFSIEVDSFFSSYLNGCKSLNALTIAQAAGLVEQEARLASDAGVGARSLALVARLVAFCRTNKRIQA